MNEFLSSVIAFWDLQFFLLINHLPHNGFFNVIGETFSGIGTAGFIWYILGIWLIFKEEKKDHWFLAPLVAAGGASWVVVEKLLKPLVARARPTPELGAIIVGDGRTDFSFPSGHTTIAWAMTVILSAKEPRWKWLFYTLAFLISFSRIYLGKHYPLDVLGGVVLGWAIGICVLWADTFFKKHVRVNP